MGQFGKIIGVGAVCLGLAAGCGEENANAQNPGAAEAVSGVTTQCTEDVQSLILGMMTPAEKAKQETRDALLKAACETYANMTEGFDVSMLKNHEFQEFQQFYSEEALNTARKLREGELLDSKIAKIQAERKKQQAETEEKKRIRDAEKAEQDRKCVEEMNPIDDPFIREVLKEADTDITCGGLLPEN